MKAIFCVPFQVGIGPVLPPMADPAAAAQLHYDDKGTLRGGYSCIGHVGNKKTCLVLIDASKATIDAMAASADYLHLDDDGAAGPIAAKNTEAWLLAQGHDAKELDNINFTDKEDALRTMLNVTPDQYTDGHIVMTPDKLDQPAKAL